MNHFKIFLLLFLFCANARATLETCSDLYVGTIRLVAPHGLQRFTLVENPEGTNSSTGSWSQWIMVDNQFWGEGERKEVLSVLLSAKAAQQKLTIGTDGADSCNISNTSAKLTMIQVQVVQ